MMSRTRDQQAEELEDLQVNEMSPMTGPQYTNTYTDEDEPRTPQIIDDDEDGIGFVYRDAEVHKALLERTEPESLNIKNLDEFFKDVYDYFTAKGFWCYFSEKAVKLFSICFMILFTTFLFILVDWKGIYSCKGQDCANVYIIRKNALHRLNLFHKCAIAFELAVIVYWFYLLYSYSQKIYRIFKAKHFYNQLLEISEKDIQTIEWDEVVEKIIQLQDIKKIYVLKSMNAFDIMNRIMRRDNFLIAFINREVLNLRVPLHYVFPFLGRRKHGVLTQGLMWNLKHIINWMFDADFKVREEVLKDPSALRYRFILLGILNMVAAPFLFFFILIYTFFKHSVKIKNSPTALMERRWNLLAHWKFREFNELPHLFLRRMKKSHKPAVKYTEQFPVYLVSILAKTVTFITSAIAASIIILSSIKNPLLLYFNVLNQNLFWWLTVLLLVYAYAKSMIIEENKVFEPKEKLAEVCSIIRYNPPHWDMKGHHPEVRDEFLELFQYSITQFIEEMLSIFVTPIILCFSLPKSAEQIVRFLDKITVESEGIGHVCGFATFNFNKFGNSAHTEDPLQKSLQMKMESSYLNFKAHYSWTPEVDNGAEVYEKWVLQQLDDKKKLEQEQKSADRVIDRLSDTLTASQIVDKLPDESIIEQTTPIPNHMLESRDYFHMLESMHRSRM